MNLRQLEEMVNVLKQKGYKPETEIMVDGEDGDLLQISQVVSYCEVSDEEPAFIALGVETTQEYPNCRAYNTDYTNPNSVFPADFPGP